MHEPEIHSGVTGRRVARLMFSRCFRLSTLITFPFLTSPQGSPRAVRQAGPPPPPVPYRQSRVKCQMDQRTDTTYRLRRQHIPLCPALHFPSSAQSRQISRDRPPQARPERAQHAVDRRLGSLLLHPGQERGQAEDSERTREAETPPPHVSHPGAAARPDRGSEPGTHLINLRCRRSPEFSTLYPGGSTQEDRGSEPRCSFGLSDVQALANF